MSDTHRCIADTKCRNSTLIDDERHGALTEKPDTLCPGCLEYIESAVHQLPRDWAELRNTLGERANNIGQKIRSSPTPAIPMSTRKEALMAEIVDYADYAADIISETLHIERTSALVQPPPDAESGSIAWNAAENSTPNQARVLAAAIAIIEPSIDLLAAATKQPALVWKSPHRCTIHAQLIADAETQLAAELKMPDINDAGPKQIKEFLRKRFKYGISGKAGEKLQLLNARYHQAGLCEDCGGWCKDGQSREIVDMTGLDTALQLVQLHNQARAELGLTRLRHKYEMPCPNCGSDVGRDDGTTIVDCKQCESAWTEREYQFLVGLITQERLDVEILKYLLAEAYWRLDTLKEAANIMRQHEVIDADGLFALEIIDAALGQHQPPDKRVPATDRKTAAARQTSDDNWAWRNETAYKPPKRKPTRARKPVENPIAASSLTLLVDIDENAVINGDARCRECNLIHAGTCT